MNGMQKFETEVNIEWLLSRKLFRSGTFGPHCKDEIRLEYLYGFPLHPMELLDKLRWKSIVLLLKICNSTRCKL